MKSIHKVPSNQNKENICEDFLGHDFFEKDSSYPASKKTSTRSFNQESHTIDAAEISSQKPMPSYLQLLLKTGKTQALIDKFSEESYNLKVSDASHKSFVPNACLERLKEGHSVVYCDYSSGGMREGHISITSETILFTCGGTKKEVNVRDVCGVMLNGMSSTFKNFTEGKTYVNSYQAFSVITTGRSFDIITDSETAKYDICISVSWLASEFSSHRVVPITKTQLTVYTVKRKIEEMAKERSMFFKEILLVKNI